MRIRGALALPVAVVALALAAPSARAGEPKLDIQLAAKDAEVELGKDLELEVTVKNAGPDATEVKELAFDRQSVSFELRLGDKTFKDVQLHDTIYAPRKYDTKTLKPGETMSKKFTIPTVLAGELEVVAVYAGGKDGKELGSEPRKLVVKGKDGATEVVAQMRTSLGPLTIRFFPHDALGTVLNFVRLAKDGFYDDKKFHRVVASGNMGVVQGGDPKGTGSGGPGYSVPAEFNAQKHTKGRLSMARSQHNDSAGSQFFLVTKETKHLDGGYSVFGEVVKGLSVLEALGEVKIEGGRQDGPPAVKISIETVRVEAAPKE